MRPTLVFSLLFTLLLEGSIAYLGEVWGGHGSVRPPREDTSVVSIVLPKEEPDPVEVEDEAKPQQTSSDLAPPMLPDLPQVATPQAFIQPIEPPLPPGARVADSATAFNGGWGHAKGDGLGVFDLSSLDHAPVVTTQVRPEYPPGLRREGVVGEVEVEFIVDVSGCVRNIRVIAASRPEFEAAAIDAVSAWKFRPGRKSGHPVNVHLDESIEFTLDF